MTLVRLTEVRTHVARPLIRFGKEDAIGKLGVERGAELPQDVVRFRKVLAVRRIALDEIWNRVEAETVHTQPQPEAHHVDDRLEHFRIVEVQIGLVTEEAMPVELLRLWIPRPVRLLGVGEDDEYHS